MHQEITLMNKAIQQIDDIRLTQVQFIANAEARLGNNEKGLDKICDKISFRDKLKKLQSYGATGYDNGKCGLHIHVSRNQIKPIANGEVF